MRAPYLHQWIPSNKLTKGEHLKTPNGVIAVADGGTTPKVHDGWMWDLTIPRRPRLLHPGRHHGRPRPQLPLRRRRAKRMAQLGAMESW